MRNLFVCHTQAHLILACGLSQGRFKDDENHLVLFRDFNLGDELKVKLQAVFETCLFLTGNFPAENKTLKARIKWHREDNKLLRKQIVKPYDRVFAVCDWTPPVQYCLKCCKKQNKDTQYIWLEDGILSYFPNIDTHVGFDKYTITYTIRKFFFKYLMGLGVIYDRDFEAMGGLRFFKQVYTLYPNAVREPYRSKRELVGISDEEYLTGVKSLYDVKSLNIPDGSILLIVDKLVTYLNPEKVKAVIAHLKEQASVEGRQIFCKFHPREELVWPVFEGCTILEKSIGAESLYLSLASQKDTIKILGIKSAGLMSARKMGFHVTSLFLQCGEQNDNLIRFFERIGVDVM
ncbi:MAG: hypothetical protein IJ064_06765 [Bacteroidaceae bacterium]|nr:hypothetical protein [Bacteroidaceae bacterium]